jgi:YVTN family beta-propeller protein
MKSRSGYFPTLIMILAIVIFLTTQAVKAQKVGSPPELVKTIELPGVKGRIDHLAFNPDQNIIYVAALGNNSVEVVDLKAGKVIHSIKGLSEPQGIMFIPGANIIFVSNGGSGQCYGFRTDTYKQTGKIKPGSDPDNVRYSSSTGKIYVGYGEGGIAVIDPGNLQILSDIKLPAHPESFQIDENAGKMFVNIPDYQLIQVIDLRKNIITDKWKISGAASNFPMALDTANHRLFTGCRNPARLIVINTETGETITSVDIDNDTDDVFYDRTRKQVYVSCGGGYIDVISQITMDAYKISSRVKTQPGARTSLLIPGLNQIITAAPAGAGTPAGLMVYQIK